MVNSKYDGLVGLLLLSKRRQGATLQQLADSTGVGVTTLRSRFDHPDKFTIGELGALGKALNIPRNELSSAIAVICS